MVDDDLRTTHAEVTAARERADEDGEQVPASLWQARLQLLLDADQAVIPSCGTTSESGVQWTVINARAHGHATQDIAGNDQHFSGS